MQYIAQVPSNIAFIKYWGKSNLEHQWPSNDSISMTLEKSFSTTKTKILERADEHRFYFMDKLLNKNDSFCQKIFKHLDMIEKRFLFKKKLEIKSHNSFPTSAGIASSASGFAALTLASLCAWSNSKSLKELDNKGFNLQIIAQLSRLGSGSACRSLLDGYIIWKRNNHYQDQNIRQLFPKNHWQLANTILIVSTKPKKISSSQGHMLAPTSPLFNVRLASLKEKQYSLLDALKNKNIKQLGEIIESEALEMHAIMMSSKEHINYFEKDTSKILAWIREIRIYKKLQIYFTLDAGPNIHVISDVETQIKFIKEVKSCYPELTFISDTTGSGPTINYME
jgi:diphosphomevalonate decarboxylase